MQSRSRGSARAQEPTSATHLCGPRPLLAQMASHGLDKLTGARFKVVIKYIRWIQDQPGLMRRLNELRFKTLVCDYPRSAGLLPGATSSSPCWRTSCSTLCSWPSMIGEGPRRNGTSSRPVHGLWAAKRGPTSDWAQKTRQAPPAQQKQPRR